MFSTFTAGCHRGAHPGPGQEVPSSPGSGDSSRRPPPAAGRLASQTLTDTIGDFSEEWVIYQVEAEPAALGYMRPQATPRWRPTPEVQRFVGDCEQLRTLEQERAQAVDRWRQVIDADQKLCDALLADCTDTITPPPTGRVKEWRITGPA
jgi:hypothetical protein